jgi:hypothetical protein
MVSDTFVLDVPNQDVAAFLQPHGLDAATPDVLLDVAGGSCGNGFILL